MKEDVKKPKTIVVKKSLTKPVDKGTTISVPPMEVHCTFEKNFESKPLWKITVKNGLGFWPEEYKGEWKKEDFLKTSQLTGDFLEIESVEKTEGGNCYILVKNGDDNVWLNVGKIKVKQGTGYELEYQYAKQIRKAQYGIRGTALVKYQDKTLEFKLMAVRAKTRRDGLVTGKDRIGTKSTPFTLVGTGLFQGIVMPRGKYETKHGDDGLYYSLSIYLWRQYEDGKWVEGVKKIKERSTNVFIHPAYIPDWLDGCLALGHNFSEYGFVSAEDSEKAMREVFELLGITTKDQFTKLQNLSWNKKPKVIITMTDKRAGSSEKATLKVRIPVDPADSKSADDTFTLYSADDSYRKTLSVKDDSKPGDKSVDLVYGDLERSLIYSLEVNPGAEGKKYFIFENLSYSDILILK